MSKKTHVATITDVQDAVIGAMVHRMADAGLTKTQSAYVLGMHLSTFSRLIGRLGIRDRFAAEERSARSRKAVAEAKERARG